MRLFFEPGNGPPWLKQMLSSIRAALGDIWDTPVRPAQFATADLPLAASYGGGIVYDKDAQSLAISDGIEWEYLAVGSASTPYEWHCFDVGDETTALTTGTAKKTFRMGYAFKLEHPDGGLGVRASLTTASSSGAVTVDVNQDGVSIFSTALTVDANEKTSKSAATPAVLSDSTLTDDAEMTVDIDGAGTGAAGLKLHLIGYRISDETNAILLSGDMSDGDDLVLLSGDMTDGDDLELQSGT